MYYYVLVLNTTCITMYLCIEFSFVTAVVECFVLFPPGWGSCRPWGGDGGVRAPLGSGSGRVRSALVATEWGRKCPIAAWADRVPGSAARLVSVSVCVATRCELFRLIFGDSVKLLPIQAVKYIEVKLLYFYFVSSINNKSSSIKI